MKNKTTILLSVLTVTAFTFGLSNLANAATYLYVDTSGDLSSLTASNAQEALRTVSDLKVNSGVMLDDGHTTDVTPNVGSQGQGDETYYYVNSSGQLSTTDADTAREALNTTDDISTHSGVMIK